jgi:hypothetical protein
VANTTLILEYLNPDQPTMINWMKPLGYELGKKIDWDEHLNGKKTNTHKLAYSLSIYVFFSLILDTSVKTALLNYIMHIY